MEVRVVELAKKNLEDRQAQRYRTSGAIKKRLFTAAHSR
jgi:hypothetical protein